MAEAEPKSTGHAHDVAAGVIVLAVCETRDHQPDGSVLSKIDLLRDMQAAGYFVLLVFVGLTNVELWILRVQTRAAENGHDVPTERLRQRFPRMQRAIAAASQIADAAILVDNSRGVAEAFMVCRVQTDMTELFDLRERSAPPAIRVWLDIVAPRDGTGANGGQPSTNPA